MRRRGRPPHPDVLTPRQWQVLGLLREGLSNEQIAMRLGISVDGVKFHVSEILGKLGVSSRNEAARWEPERTPAPTASLHTSRWRPRRTRSATRAVAPLNARERPHREHRTHCRHFRIRPVATEETAC